jgi:lysophospholipid acyltransferase (LPLAT)-like uncharacterized protein
VASEYRFSQRVMLAVVPRLAAALIRALMATLRFEDVFEAGAQSAFDHPRPVIFVFWHRALLASAGHFRKQGIAILISRSFDGELIARTVERLGFVAVRGSSSRGGAAGLMAMQQAFADGRLVAITADGPRGPKYVAKPGTAQLAQLTHSPVCAFHVLPQRAWTLKSWDSFLIPKPFSRVVVTYPARVEFNGNAETTQADVQAALDRSVAMAEQYWGSGR